jgi:hypothetical protein
LARKLTRLQFWKLWVVEIFVGEDFDVRGFLISGIFIY